MFRQLQMMVVGLVVFVGLSATPIQSVQAKDKVYTSTFSSQAVSGHDPVAYFRAGKPVKGNKKFSHDWNGATWLFSSAENLAAFKEMPEKFAPQYGGYCAWAVSQGYTASSDPEAWHIENGKLYLNYSKSVQATWAEDIPGHIKKADANWPKVIQ